jgi:gluconolactonase
MSIFNRKQPQAQRVRRAAFALAGLLAFASVPVSAAADGLDGIIAPDAKLEKVVTGLKFAEGPVWDGTEMIVSDVKGDTAYAVSEDGSMRVFKHPTHWGNGHSWDRSGALLTAEHASGEVTRTNAQGVTVTLASRFEGKRLNSPNDVIVRSDGLIYITDPPFGLQPPYGPVKRAQELDFAGVYLLNPQTRVVTALIKDLKYPNGIVLSPDETLLYVNDTATQKVWVFDVTKSGHVQNRRLFADLSLPGSSWVVDGMKVDSEGRVYSVCPAGVCVLSQDGKQLGTISIPEQPTDVAWGGNAHNVLYVTATTSVYRITTLVRGVGSDIK